MARRSLVVALEGPSGAGKSRVAGALASRFGWAVVAEAVDRLDPAPSLAFRGDDELLGLERALLNEDARRFATARELALHKTVVVDTGFLGTLSYTAGLVAAGAARPTTLRRLVGRARTLARTGRLGVPDLSVYLSVAPSVIARRLRASPVRHPVELRGRHARVGRFEFDTVRPWLDRVLPARVVTLRATGTPAAIASRIERRSRTVAPLADPCGAADRALGDARAAWLAQHRRAPRQPL